MAMVPPGASALKVSGEQSFAALDAFAVQNVAERGDVVAAAVIGLLQVAFDESEAIGNAKPGDGIAGNGNHAMPVNGGDVDLRRNFAPAQCPRRPIRRPDRGR